MKKMFIFLVVCATTTVAFADLSLTAMYVASTEDFESYLGTGIAPNGGAPGNALDSNDWRTEGLSAGNTAFGGIYGQAFSFPSDYGRGNFAGGVVTGGFYSFSTGGGNEIFGWQPDDTDLTPGFIVLRLQNNTGETVEKLSISYDIWTFNDQGRANSLNFSSSSDDSAYTSVGALDYTTPEIAEGSPAWALTQRGTVISGLSIPNGAKYYLRWTMDDVSGSGGRDEYGIDNISVTPIPEPASVVLLGVSLAILTVCRRRKSCGPAPTL